MNISFFTILKDGLLSAPQIGWRTTSPVNKKHLIFVSRFVVIPPLSPERKTCCMLSFALTYSILLSTIRRQRPGCQYYWNQRFHNSMDLQPMTTSPCRHSPSLSREGNMWYPSTFLYSNKVESTIHRLRRSPFLSRKEHRFSCFPLISFRMLALCKKRTFCFIPVICKDCTILSREWHNHSCGLMVYFKAE